MPGFVTEIVICVCLETHAPDSSVCLMIQWDKADTKAKCRLTPGPPSVLKKVGKGSSVPSCRSTARHLISCGNMQNGPAEEVLSLYSPWQR